MPDNIFKGSYEGASSTGSGQQIHKKAVFFLMLMVRSVILKKGDTGQCCRGDYKTGEEWPSRHGCVQEEAGRLCLIIWNRSLLRE